ncbi:MAG TPA: TetR/AcrR family transcriptional regulator [Streptosporangiaceae bacterium]|nr:TetR/AcrR family transcriptional regulator [Streptosporangiaceae bacterium]
MGVKEPVSGEAPSRAGWGTISRERLVLAATDQIEAEGYEQLTIRSLAARLGVAPMSLYRHVRNKEDLLNEVVDRLLAGAWRPAADAADVQTWVLEAADRLRRLLVGQPAALQVYLSHPVTTPAALARQSAVLEVLRASGLDEPSARRLYAIIHTYTLGFAALESSRARWLARHPELADPDTAWLAAMTGSEQFSEGLAALLAGAIGSS